MKEKINILELLSYIDPTSCNYNEWFLVGMALKEEGFSVQHWDDWSSRDPARYHHGECEKKWASFNGNEEPVTGGTIYQMAIDRGWRPEVGKALDWNDTIKKEGIVIDQCFLDGKDIPQPQTWEPEKELIRYLEILFEAGENVGYVVQSWQNEKGKYIPQNKGNFARTAGQLIEELSKCNGDIGSVLGDYNPDGGAWIRFNPLDGNGVRNENVTDFRYALVESDNMDIEKQYQILSELELPIAVIVHSGAKSLHAIIKIEASDKKEYQKRVEYLYQICLKNGMSLDTQNKNPSRLSRMPGIMRNGKKQFIVASNIGKTNWNEWKEWIESVNDELPNEESLADVWNNVPDLAPNLIENVLREGHKMLITGPSKAGKSILLIELAIAIAEGKSWLGWKCEQGQVLYVNLEVDRASCLHRFQDIYKAAGIAPTHLNNLDVWNLRGLAIPMNELAPKLIRRARKKQYKAIIIDPIYKVITGDENSADQMSAFCNQFDKICTELKCAVIYCHHHSKGMQGQKRSMDRASGSGVFARDPDALLDMIELEVTDTLRKQEENKAVCAAIRKLFESGNLLGWMNWKDEIGQDDWMNQKTLLSMCENKLSAWEYHCLVTIAADMAKKRVLQLSAWRIEGTLREFPTFAPINTWFDYPIHILDTVGVLSDVQIDDGPGGYKKMLSARKEQADKQRADMLASLRIAFEGLEKDGVASAIDIAEEIGVSSDTIKRWFGKGRRARADYKKEFDTYEDEKDRKLYLRKKTQ